MIDIRSSNDVTGASGVPDTGLPAVPAKAGGAQPGGVQQAAGASAGVSREKLDHAISQLADYVQSLQRDLHFDVDESSGRMVIRVVDRRTQELVRQIPEEVVLDLAQKLNAEEPLRLFSARA